MSKAWHGRAGIELRRLAITYSDALQMSEVGRYYRVFRLKNDANESS